MRGQFFEPDLIIMMEAGFVVVDKDRCGYVHRIAEDKSIFNPTFFHEPFHGAGNIHKSNTIWDFKGQILGQRFHFEPLSR